LTVLLLNELNVDSISFIVLSVKKMEFQRENALLMKMMRRFSKVFLEKKVKRKWRAQAR
jgi:hypothetical protein